MAEETAEADLVEAADSVDEETYDARHGTPFFAVRPDRVCLSHGRASVDVR